jgi:hypothetical protein
MARASIAAVVAGALVALAALAVIITAGPSRARAASGGTPSAQPLPPANFSWLYPAPAPSSWRSVTTPTTRATLFFPPGWRAIPGDKGTVTEALRDSGGLYVGYLNVTPRQGAERLRGWAAFRTIHNREDGDQQVHPLISDEGLRFRHAEGSCVIDDYLSRVGSHPYREIACIVTGSRHTDVFIAAAFTRDWRTLGPTIERATSAFVQH